MKVAIYPGSFNPWHKGHENIVDRALRVFDKVVLAVGKNPDKAESQEIGLDSVKRNCIHGLKNGCLELVPFDGLLSDYIKDVNKNDQIIHAVVRGLRNAQDFEFEKTQQYWNEDLLIGIPTYYVIADRSLAHISSSAIRAVKKIKKEE